MGANVASATGQLSGKQKAAAVLIALGPELSAKVMRCLEPADVERLTFEILNLQKVPPEVKDAAVGDCHAACFRNQGSQVGGSGYATKVLERAVGPSRAMEILERLTSGRTKLPFEFLHTMDPQQLTGFIQHEHPETIALILAHLDARLAGTILSRLEPELQSDVATRIASMSRTSPQVVDEVQDVLKRRLSAVIGRDFAAAGGVGCLVRILGQSNRATERSILTSLEAAAPELAEEVRKQLFVFEDIVLLDDRSIQRVLREVDSKDLAVALKNTREDVRQRIFKNISSRAAEILEEDIASLGPVRVRTVEEAQQRIVNIIRRLDEAEEIVISRGADGDVFV